MGTSTPGQRGIGTAVAAAVLALLLAFAGTAGIGHAAAADWPSYRGGPTQNMSSPEDPGKFPQQLWEGIESVRSEPCVIASGDSVFTVSTPRDDFGLQRLFRLELASGKVVWSSPTFSTSEQQSCPAAGGGYVFYPHGGSLTARSISDGAQAWEVNLPAELGKPVFSEGRVYVENSTTLFALDAEDGSILWTGSAQYAFRPPLVVAGAVISISEEGLIAFSADSGSQLWSASGFPNDAIGTGDSVVYSPGGSSVVSRDALTGAVNWTYLTPTLTRAGRLVADEGIVYALTPSNDVRFQANHLVALAEDTGEPVYTRKFEMTSGCCGTTSTYVPFVKFGPVLYNQYRYFVAANGESPGTSSVTQNIFSDGSCANEQDSAFAKVGLTVVVWKGFCGHWALVAKQGQEGPPPPELLKPEAGGLASGHPLFEWRVDSTRDLSGYELLVDGSVFAKVPAQASVVTSFRPGEAIPEGSHTWSVAAVDTIGRRALSSGRSIEIDATPPEEPELLEPAAGADTETRPRFSWQPAVDAGAGLQSYELLVDERWVADIPAGTESYSLPYDLTPGAHVWALWVNDQVSNSRFVGPSSFNVTSSLGAATLVRPLEGIVEARPEFEWLAPTDPGAGLDHYELSIDGMPVAQVSANGEMPSFVPSEDLADGSHTWSVRTVDALGSNSDSQMGAFAVDSSPPAPFALLEPAEGAVTDARPHFTWEAAADVGPAGLDHYELCIDEGLRIELPAGDTSYLPSADLSVGSHVWWVEAVDGVGHRRSVGGRKLIVASPPKAVLSTDQVLALTGVPVALDASASSPPPAGAISGFRWDLDGNGSFETDTGTSPTASHTYSQVGDRIVSVRVLSNLGTEATASATVSVRPAPPSGPLGITINGGAQFTNTPSVTVSVIWPDFAATAALSNDGGFHAASERPLAASVPWTLESSGSERLPKTVYVRFQGGSAGRETYQDDIILDQQKPKVGKAALTGEGVLELSARDNTSGVVAMQIATARWEGRWRPFERTLEFSRRHQRSRVRVKDRAGNFSLWRRVRMPERTGGGR